MIKRFKSSSNPKGVGQKSNTSIYNSMRYANPKKLYIWNKIGVYTCGHAIQNSKIVMIH